MDEEYDFRENYRVGDIVYYLRVMENLGVNEIVEGTVRTIQSDYMVVACKTTMPTLYVNKKSKDLIYIDRKLAIKESKKYTVKKVTRDKNTDEYE